MMKYTILFFIGSTFGWLLEVIFRHYFSDENPEHKWINPGCCTGPYLPLYGCGLCVLYFLASFAEAISIGNTVWDAIILLLLMTVCMTVLEYVAGIMSLKIYHVRLWDYSNMRGNIQGIICPLFSFFWTILCALYYFLLHSHIANVVRFSMDNMWCCFGVGIFYGIFIIDLMHSLDIMNKFRKFAKEYNAVVRYESVKVRIRSYHDGSRRRYNFFRPFRTDKPLGEHLKEMIDGLDQKVEKIHKIKHHKDSPRV